MTDIPGPGNYENDFIGFGKGGQKVSIIGKSKEMSHLDVPGPGSYDNSDRLVKNKSVAFKIGSGTRGDFVNKSLIELPGPGNYNET